MGGCEPVRIKHLAAGCATALLIPRGTAAADLPARLHVFWNDRPPLCRDSRYDLRRGRRLKSFAPGLRRRAGCLGWRDNPLLEIARWPFLFAGFRRTLMLGVGRRAHVDARWGRWCIRACEDRGDLAPIGEQLVERTSKPICRLGLRGPRPRYQQQQSKGEQVQPSTRSHVHSPGCGRVSLRKLGLLKAVRRFMLSLAVAPREKWAD